MKIENLFKYRHFAKEIILLAVRRYLRFNLSYRDVQVLMLDRQVEVSHTTVFRWVRKYAPEINKRCRKYLHKTTDSYRIDETYLKIKGVPHFLYRAIDFFGSTIDFMLSRRRDAKAAKKFFCKILRCTHATKPRVFNTDMDKAYPAAFKVLKSRGKCKLRRIRYLNNIIEQDHRFIKKLIRAGMGFKSFLTAIRTLQGYETVHMIRKGQIKNIQKDDYKNQANFVNLLFEIAA